ncbi:MAG: hypothetical protein IJ908_08315 [Fibrobacter sp.]|jgi:hypothetical protein|nr:hypothetical protein [Fibrobacter sp.]MBR6853941.1 hypothetical protein [Fibrobacter sp.]MBR6942416.1 hypothetical protein [Fibrobacter sp.]
MSEYVVKIALIASIVLMGYNISEFIASFKSVNEKIEEFLGLVKQNDATGADLRRSNFILSCLLSIGYASLIYFSDVVLWLVVLIVLKLFLTLFLSDKLLVQVLRDGSLSKKNYLVSKYDALFNAAVGFVFAVILVI